MSRPYPSPPRRRGLPTGVLVGLIVVFFVGLIASCGFGAALGSTSGADPTPSPSTVTVTVTAVETVTVAPSEPPAASATPSDAGPAEPAEPQPTATREAAPVPPPAPPPAEAYYANCTQARAAGAAPLYVGEPGYRKALDRDGDGVACE
jgi:hypothetical protein